jgi:signal transduction histidine kinase/CheY-like chemotaxis protein
MKSSSPIRLEMALQVLDVIPFPVYTFDRQRKILYANKAALASQSDLAPGQSLGSAKMHHFEDNEYYDEKGDRIPAEQLRILGNAFNGQATNNLLLEHRNIKNRTHTWLEITCVPVMDDAGQFSYGILMTRDASQKKKREDKLKFLMASTKILSITIDFHSRLKQKASLVVPSLADWCSIEILNSDGEILREALIHRDPKKIEFIQEFERLYPQKPGEESTAERVIRTGKGEFTPVVTQEMIDAAPGLEPEQRIAIGKLQLSSIMSLPIGLPGRVLGVLNLAYAESGRIYQEEDFKFFSEFAQHLSVLLDNARLYNEISIRDEAKDVFLASLSHELRNPLAPIRSSLDLLRLQEADGSFTQELSIIEHQFDHLAHLLNDLLDTARFLRGRISLDLQTVELVSIVTQVTQAMKPVAREKGIDLSLVMDESSYVISADPVRLEQALTNVIHNALKFTPSGGTIVIELLADTDSVVIKVRDSGAGITADEMGKIFEPYYQSDRVRNVTTSGLGIGLRLVFEIMKLHGGTSTAESEGKDRGSTFILTFPRLSTSVTKISDSLGTQGATTKEKKIIIVDDNHAAADGIVRLLKALNWNAKAFYGGKDLLSHLSEESADLLFVDIGMPDMNGYEVIQHLRSKGYTLPAVALTGYGLAEDKKDALEAGFAAHLTKPVGVREIRTTLAELL